VANVAALYQAGQALPTFDPGDETIRVLHVSDVHLNPQAFDLMLNLVDEFQIDVVVDTGDTTDWGTEPEARIIESIGTLGVPYVWVRGNHDSKQTQAAVAAQPNAVVLDGEAREVGGLRFFGVGDPRYTPDKGDKGTRENEREIADGFASTVDRMLSLAEPREVDVLAVHDPRIAADSAGRVPLILAGHTHEHGRKQLDGALLLVQGSTGGAGLRGLQGEFSEPLTCAVLYFERGSSRLLAYDQITVRGLGQRSVQLERHTVAAPSEADEP
jgi:predicted MPP superfamily phosphohydrolase